MVMIPTSSSVLPFIDERSLFLLKGEHVRLESATERHRELIRPLARDERIWEFTKTLLIDDEYDLRFDQYFDEALHLTHVGAQAFVIRTVRDNRIIGMTRLYDIDRKDKRLEIGYTWYVPEVWGKVYNKECKLLLLQYALDTLQFNRVQFRVAHQNIRSQKAVANIGGVKEGVLRRHAIRNDGSPRDTVVFSIIIDEWPERKEHLRRLVAAGRL
jgi:RimJ/RimL family protein N-acetyltransferase